MPELDIPQTGTTIASGTFGQPVVYRVVSRYASEAARDAETPSGAGETCYVQDIDEFQAWDGSQWVTYQPVVPLQTQTVTVDNGVLEPKGNFEYTWRDDSVVTCAVAVTFNSLSPGDVFTLTGAIPAAFRPPTVNFWVPLIIDNGSGSIPGPSARFNPDGSVTVIPSSSAPTQGNARGIVSWMIGADGSDPIAP